MAIATQMTIGIAEPPTTTILPGRIYPDVTERQPQKRPADISAGRGNLLSKLREDHLVRNSLYLMLSSGLQAVLGFTFWVVMARLFSTGDVGKASSLISASGLIAYFALLGLNSTLVRFLPTASDYSSLITAAFLLVTGCAAVISAIYVLLLPLIAPRLVFIYHQPVLAIGFIVLSAGVALNLLTDAVFLAARRANYTALTDGIVGGVSKIVFGVALVGTGAYGLFGASVGGIAAAALVSLLLIMTVLHWHPTLRNPFGALRPVLRFSGANYVANAFNLLPAVVIPLIVLDRLGSQSSAYYYVAYQMASLLYAAIYAVESAFFAEGSQAGADWRAIRRKSRRLAVTIFVPGGIVLALVARWVLLVFGGGYSAHGTVALEVMALAVVPMAIYNWAATVLKLLNRLSTLVLCNAVYALGICCTAWILAPHGLGGVAASWLIGSTGAAVVTTVAAGSMTHRARHRKARPTSKLSADA
jgi:O-antigen/teichoic acid export membrane protein